MPETKNGKVLVVDDDLFNLDILGRYLEAVDFGVLRADDGDVALKMLAGAQASDVIAIILDLEMPRMDGMALLKEIKKIPALKDIPVIIQTAVDNRKWKTTPGLENVFAYLMKPYDPEKLIALVQAALEKT
jgi:CheY-like chemotaxis protein